jgi:hypothetical protein
MAEDDRRAVRKVSYDAHFAAHGFDGFSQRGKQQVAAFFEAGDAVLGDSEGLGEASLRQFAGLAEVAQAHFLGNDLSRAILDSLSLGWPQFPNYFIHICGHRLLRGEYGMGSI